MKKMKKVKKNKQQTTNNKAKMLFVVCYLLFDNS